MLPAPILLVWSRGWSCLSTNQVRFSLPINNGSIVFTLHIYHSLHEVWPKVCTKLDTQMNKLNHLQWKWTPIQPEKYDAIWSCLLWSSNYAQSLSDLAWLYTCSIVNHTSFQCCKHDVLVKFTSRLRRKET